MSFGLPSAFWWSLLALPVIVFYILKVRLRRAPTSTTMFWNQIFDEKPPRSIWETLKHLLSLLLQLALLGLLVVSVADPFLPGQLKAARRIVLVVDNSASMRATDVAPSRLAAAIERGVRIVDGLRFGDEMAVILASDHPQVLIGMSGHAPTLKRTIEQIAPSDCPTSILPGVDLGRRLIGDHPHGEIVVLTDGCFPESDALLTAKDVSLEIFGTAAGNIGITQFQARRSFVDPLGYELLTSVRNASDVPVECRLEIELDGATVDILPLKLAANETWSRSLEKTSLEGGRLSARLTELKRQEAPADTESGIAIPLDALASDSTAYAILPARKIQNVLLVTPGNLFLQKVFEANKLVRLTVVKELPKEWPADTVVALHRTIPVSLPPRDILVFDPAGDCDAWKIEGEIENPIVTKQDAASPLMTHLKLDNVVMPKAKRLAFAEPPQILAGAVNGEPLFAALKRPGFQKGVVLAVDLDEGDLTFRTAFPIMVTNALSWFAGTAGELQPAVATGSIMKVPIDAVANRDAALELELRAPSDRRQPLGLSRHETGFHGDEPRGSLVENNLSSDVAAGLTDRGRPMATVGPLNEVGVWEILESRSDPKSPAPPVLAAFAANLASPLETDIRPSEKLRASVNQALAAGSWFSRPLWFYLACVVVALATVEWFLYQRRLIR